MIGQSCKHLITLLIATAALSGSGCRLFRAPSPGVYPASGREVVDTVYYENGKKQVERGLSFGVPQGTSTTWYANGEKRSETAFSRGIKDGPETLWWDNGQKMSECVFRVGKISGPLKEWYPNGQQRTDYTYVDGLPDGPFSVWWDKGQKRCEGMYKSGVRVGMYKEWDEQNNLVLEKEYPLPQTSEPEPGAEGGAAVMVNPVFGEPTPPEGDETSPPESGGEEEAPATE